MARHLIFGSWLTLVLAVAVTLTSGEVQRAVIVIAVCSGIALVLTGITSWALAWARERSVSRAREY